MIIIIIIKNDYYKYMQGSQRCEKSINTNGQQRFELWPDLT